MFNADHKSQTYLHEFFERGVIRHFIDDAVLGYRIVRDVLHILLAPVQRGIQSHSGNTVDDWAFVALDGVEAVKWLAVMYICKTKMV